MIKKGDRVILSAPHYIPTPEYPVWGSEHECVGTVRAASKSGSYDRYTIYVDWDNGKRNHFVSSNISLAGNRCAKLNPNSIFKAKNESSRRR